MNKITLSILTLVLMVVGTMGIQAAEKDISTSEFRQLYDSILAGKTLTNTKQSDGVTITAERKFGQAIDLGENDFEVPSQSVITRTKDGNMTQKITINIVNHVTNLGNSAIISEEQRRMVVESSDSDIFSTNDIEFNGLYRVSKNDKVGFDIHNIGLIPTVVVEDGQNELVGMNITYSCYAENALTTCELTIRDYHLGDYKPLVGYELKDTVGGDHIEIFQEVKQ